MLLGDMTDTSMSLWLMIDDGGKRKRVAVKLSQLPSVVHSSQGEIAVYGISSTTVGGGGLDLSIIVGFYRHYRSNNIFLLFTLPPPGKPAANGPKYFFQVTPIKLKPQFRLHSTNPKLRRGRCAPYIPGRLPGISLDRFVQ